MKAAPLLAAVLLVCRLAGAQDVPTPPGQTQPWTAPPTSLPDVVVSATAALFDLGMADPRGCEYREVEIAFDRAVRKQHAWVLPAMEGKDRRAIGWNGLVYPVQSVGAPADLAKDIASAARQRFSRDEPAYGEVASLSFEYPEQIQVALLLRRGEARLAETCWQNGWGNDLDMARADPYATMAATWLAQWYNRAETAYLHGNYPAALALCRELSVVEAKARALARERGNPDPWTERRYAAPLWQLPALTAESQRRIDERPYVSILDSGRPAAGPGRIAALIRDLELVNVHQWAVPGEVDVAEDPAVQALARAGDAAVPALLRCLVEDQRLTRSRYTYGSSDHGPIIPVYEAAYVALFNMWNVKFPLFEHDRTEDGRGEKEPRDLGPGDRRALAAKLEDYWRQNRGVDPLERAYATLRDDHAAAKAWLQAVDDLVQPGDGTSTEYRLEFPAVGGYSYGPVPAPVPPRGEPLRGRTDPSVTELIVRRAAQLIGDDANTTEGKPETLGKLLLALAAWDGRSHLDDLRRLQGELQAKLRRLTAEQAEQKGRDTGPHRVEEGEPAGASRRIDLYGAESALELVFEKRLELGDATVLQEDADHLLARTPAGLRAGGTEPADRFRLLWRHPDDPAMARAAETLFAEGSPWVPFVKSASGDLSGLIRTPLIAVPAFRRELDRGLGDTSAAGEVLLGEDGHVNDGTSRLYPLDPLAPPKGSKVTYRLCDHYAYELSRQNGFPRCELYWPQADRDRAVAACRLFLHRYADNFRYDEKEDKGRDLGFNGTFTSAIHFPVLDHPATPEDVSAGRAIFSLPPPARVCRLPGLPRSADRPGRREDPYGFLADAESGTNHLYTTSGRVWQAEETLVGGRWERYYGFVGRYQLEKVPAAEIEFPDGRLGIDVTPEISAEIDITRRLVSAAGSFFGSCRSDFVTPGAPVPVRVKLGNHSPLDQTVPGALALPPGAGRALPPGIHLSLSYSGKVPMRTKEYADPPFDYGAWQEVPLRGEVRPAPGDAAGPVLTPGQTLTVVDSDLRDYFDVSRAGSYRLRAAFRVPGQPESQAGDGIIFSVAE